MESCIFEGNMAARRRLPRPFVPSMTLGEAFGPASLKNTSTDPSKPQPSSHLSTALPLNPLSSLPLSSSRSNTGNDGDDALKDEHVPYPSPGLGGDDYGENDSAGKMTRGVANRF